MSTQAVEIRTIELNSDITFNESEQQAIRQLLTIDIPDSKTMVVGKSRKSGQNRRNQYLHDLNDREYRELFPDLAVMKA